jgi:(2Fe-2S) ferredoxin
LRDCLKKALKARGLDGQVRANQAGCLNQCEWGPTLVIYPQGIWYGGVKLEDVPRIVEETIIGGKVIEELRIPDQWLNTPEGKAAGKQRRSDAAR